jgi:hypothetical protein
MPTPLSCRRAAFGIPDLKLFRMHAIAAAALDRLDTEALRMRDVAEVGASCGASRIRPFCAELVTVRALGRTDVLPTTEPRVMAATAVGSAGSLSPPTSRVAETGGRGAPEHPWPSRRRLTNPRRVVVRRVSARSVGG